MAGTKRRTRGRPSPVSEIPEQTMADAIALAKAGAPQDIIADRLRIHVGTFRKWMRWGDTAWEPREGDEVPKDREPYRHFREAIREAQAQPVVLCEATWLRAVQGIPAKPAKLDAKGNVIEAAQPAVPGDARAAERWLKLHRPDLYREQIDVELTGSLATAADAALESIRTMVENATAARKQ